MTSTQTQSKRPAADTFGRRWRTVHLVGAVIVASVMASALGIAAAGRGEASTATSAVAALRQPTGNQALVALDHESAARFCLLLMEEGGRVLTDVDDIRAVFHRRERKDGELLPLHVTELKVRRHPKSVYMRWREPHSGREAIWQENANDGNVLVHAGGWRRHLVPLLALDPLGERATEESQRPITEIGIWNFHHRLFEQLREDVNRPGARLTLEADSTIGGRACFGFELHHLRREDGAAYHILRVYIDRELVVPLAFERYDWPSEDNEQAPILAESYAFMNLELGAGLSDIDFDVANPSYDYGPSRVTRK